MTESTADADIGLGVVAGMASAELTQDEATTGGSLGFEAEWRIIGAASLWLSAIGSRYFSDEPSYSGTVVAGASYTIDDLRYQPYASIGAGIAVFTGGDVATDSSATAHVGVGLDAIHSPRFRYGVYARVETRIVSRSLVSVGGRAMWHWSL